MGVKTKLTGAALVTCAALLMQVEGLRLRWYSDPVGIRTDCVGHTGPDVRPVNTKLECATKLESDIAKADSVVAACYPDSITQNQRAALVSLAFNVGPGGKGVKDGVCLLKTGAMPTIRRKFIAGDAVGACNEFPKWANPPLKGLIDRRAKEMALCLKE